MKKYQTYLFIILLCSFNVFAQSIINITSPNGGESWQTGLEQTITWSGNITEDVKIDLYKGVFLILNCSHQPLVMDPNFGQFQ